jgi:hypothetical protein
MPPTLEPKPLDGLPQLFTSTQARQYLGLGVNRWNRVQFEIDHVKLGVRRLYTVASMTAWLQKNSIKGRPLEPRARSSTPPPQPPPPKPKPKVKSRKSRKAEPAETLRA